MKRKENSVYSHCLAFYLTLLFDIYFCEVIYYQKNPLEVSKCMLVWNKQYWISLQARKHNILDQNYFKFPFENNVANNNYKL